MKGNNLFNKVKCEQLIEKVALEALKSMSYTVTPLSAMQDTGNEKT